jgi:hypothetical protein
MSFPCGLLLAEDVELGLGAFVRAVRQAVRFDYFVLTVITVMTGFTSRLVVELVAQRFANRYFVARDSKEGL